MSKRCTRCQKELTSGQIICLECATELKAKPTLDECIREWEERGWTKSKGALSVYNWIYFTKGEAEITFYLDTITYHCDCNYELNIDIDLHNLIGKTLKAMEVENDK